MKPGEYSGDLIPGLPNDAAELCLLRLPFPHAALARSVSPAWNQTLSDPNFLRSKSNLSLSLPHLFALASDPLTRRLQWQALDPRSRRWFVLPQMPSTSGGARICGASLACAADGEKGEMYVVGGMAEGGEAEGSVRVYSAASNSWRVGMGQMRRGRAYFAAAAIGGRVFVAGGGDGGIAEVEMYDPARDRWDDVAAMTTGMARYDAAVVGRKLLMTEGWTWPFTFTPRGGVYDADLDSWEEMSVGMREGWTGISAVVGRTLFVVSEYSEGRVKVYDPAADAWSKVVGGGVPEELKKPFAVVGSAEEEGGRWRIEWEVVKGPKAFGDLAPCNAQLLYA